MTDTIQCAFCGKEVPRISTNQKYCGEACKKVAIRQGKQKPYKAKKKPSSSISNIDAEARACGMSYGQYVATMREVNRMDWKREAVDKLRGYEAHQRALENIPNEIKRLEAAFDGIRSATTDSTPVSGGGSTREDSLLSNIVHREELKRTLRQAEIWVDTVDSGLEVLSEQERLILDRFFIHMAKGNVDRLCGELGVEQSSVYRRRDNALRHFTIALYGATET